MIRPVRKHVLSEAACVLRGFFIRDILRMFGCPAGGSGAS